jgi:hypothetical protein
MLTQSLAHFSLRTDTTCRGHLCFSDPLLLKIELGASFQLSVSFDLLVLTSEIMNMLQMTIVLTCSHENCVDIRNTEFKLSAHL